MSLFYGYIASFGCASIVIAADILMKYGADRGHAMLSTTILGGALLYALSAAAWFAAMRHIPLTQAAVAYSVFSLLALCLVGVVVFGETLAWREVAGIGCAITSVILMVRLV